MNLGQIGKYQLIKHLGNGAFGDVFLAHDHALNTQKAIKILNAPDANDVMKKLEEAQILHKCMHKNIVHINEANVFEINSSRNVVIDMEYLPRGSFENAIKHNMVSIHSTLRLIIDCLFALEHAHINGILHRDVKPANILLCDFGAKLSDFGLATVLGLHAAGSPEGYITHLPPEFFIHRQTTALTDIFAVGITLFRACNYISDWDGAIRMLSDPDKLIGSGRLISSLGYAPFIPQKLKRIINLACSVDPIKRYQRASEFRHALERLSPQIDWTPANQNFFQGMCVNTGASFSIALIPTRKTFKVEIKKNNRRQGSLCRSFDDLNRANKYFYQHISSTLFS
ncbi:serine/threonine protein kinase [Desulfonema ishimotonii]|uniref:Serine/threonine protein kinase n=1 Tax=Desulfonema ishimotonii TaxID=45657 RepID=A0A401FXA5_9BACT|nr:serine/threonine-protein kinase [Desulfonema ishimotonii]GBC61591.1 serine/threonine protein kinase [Desulfonema ishimotonii]